MRVIGIDPGLGTTGLGVLDTSTSGLTLVWCGTIKTNKNSTMGARLAEMRKDLTSILAHYKPATAIVEHLIAGGRAGQAAIQAAHGRGVILEVLASLGIRVVGIYPSTAKRIVAGHGNATKGEMQDAVMRHLALPGRITPDDAADAVANAMAWWLSEEP